jgi:RimJ/RimL family protein N-acetyltransferase
MKFPSPLRLPIENQLTGRSYELVGACDVGDDDATVARIVSICNEPAVYEWLFRGPLEGRPYEEAKAREWLRWAKDGWTSGTHFVFAVLDDQQCIVAACAIKGNTPSAEVGYWASQWHRGVMTNALLKISALAAGAGFRELFAKTKKGNSKSQGVLRRAGFTQSADDEGGYERFSLRLGA